MIWKRTVGAALLVFVAAIATAGVRDDCLALVKGIGAEAVECPDEMADYVCGNIDANADKVISLVNLWTANRGWLPLGAWDQEGDVVMREYRLGQREVVVMYSHGVLAVGG